MTIHIDKLFELLAELCESKNLKAAGTECLKGGLMTGICAVLGGMLLGPAGLAVGGALGGIGSAVAAKDFRPVAVILREMPPNKKLKLANTLRAAFRDFGIEDAMTLAMMLTANSSIQSLAIKEISNFLNREMSMRVQEIKQ